MNKILLKSLTQEDLDAISRRFKEELTVLYGERLERLVLFGSYARGNYTPDSDVDYLVVLNQHPVQFGQEVDKISQISSDLGIEYTVHISAKPVSVVDYKSSSRLFYQAVRSEGITL
ncbi:nucleotidyltransferase family protein [Fibrella arboris]|uniref:nucleotidyltransferase family protein n=1 Tax=Fibrella arboris TaxID=3242486 RepID=UPI00351FFFAA